MKEDEGGSLDAIVFLVERTSGNLKPEAQQQCLQYLSTLEIDSACRVPSKYDCLHYVKYRLPSSYVCHRKVIVCVFEEKLRWGIQFKTPAAWSTLTRAVRQAQFRSSFRILRVQFLLVTAVTNDLFTCGVARRRSMA